MLKRNSRVFLFTQFCHALNFTIPIWIVYYAGFNSPAQIATMMVVQYALQMVMELPSGALADLLGRKKSLMLAFSIGTVGYLLFPFANKFEHFILLAIMIGISDSFRSGSEEALVYDTYKQSNNDGFERVFSKGNLVYQAGLIIGTLAGGLLYQINAFVPFILTGVAFLVGFIGTLFYVEPKLDTEKFTVKNYVRQISKGLREAFKDKLTTYTSLFYIFVGGITWTNSLFFGSYFVIGLGFGDAERGYIEGSIRLLNALAIAYVLSKVKLNDTFRVLFFPAVMLLGFLPGAFVTGWAGVPFLELAMLAGTSRWIFLTPLTNRAFSSNVRATAISVLSLLIGFVYIAVVGISGPIIENNGIGTMYTVLGIITLVTVVPLGMMLLKTRRDMRSQTPLPLAN